MTKHIGRQFSIGIGKEGTRGTATAATAWLPDTTLSIDDKVTVAKDETAIGVIEDGNGQDVTSQTSEATIEGRVSDTSFGHILMALMGTDTKTTTSGESAVYDHTFSVLQTAQHPSYTLCAHGPNDDLAYPLGMLDSLDLTFELDKYAMFKAAFKANGSASQDNTPSFSAENVFLPKDITVGYADTIADLGSATAVNAKKLTLAFKKNTLDEKAFSNANPIDRLNQQFGCEGSLELSYDGRTLIDDVMLADVYKALRVSLTSGVTIGSTSHPMVQFTFARVKLSEVSRKMDNNGIVSMTVKFTAFYSLSDAKMLAILLRNVRATAY